MKQKKGQNTRDHERELFDKLLVSKSKWHFIALFFRSCLIEMGVAKEDLDYVIGMSKDELAQLLLDAKVSVPKKKEKES